MPLDAGARQGLDRTDLLFSKEQKDEHALRTSHLFPIQAFASALPALLWPPFVNLWVRQSRAVRDTPATNRE